MRRWFDNRSLRLKIIIVVLPVVSILVLLQLGIAAWLMKESAIDSAIEFASAKSKRVVLESRENIDKAYEAVAVLADIQQDQINKRIFNRAKALGMYRTITRNNPIFLSVWGSFELGAFGEDDKKYIGTEGANAVGRFSSGIYWEGNDLALQVTDEAEVASAEYHQEPKRRKANLLMDPYLYSYTASDTDLILMTSVVKPILRDGEFLGAIGIDISLDTLQAINQSVNFF